MAIIIEPSKGKAPQIDDGLYPVICRGVKSVTVDNDQFGNFEKVELSVEVEGMVDEDGDPVTLDPRCNRKWGEKATLYSWALAFGLVASVNESFDAEEFEGKRAMALVETPEDGGWPRVTKFSKRTSKAKAAAPADDTPPWDEKRTVPTLLNDKGEVDWTAFWTLMKNANIARSEVAAEVNGDIENLMSMEPTLVPDFAKHMLDSRQ